MSALSSPILSESFTGELITSPTGKCTRTVAMIKHHALDHRFDIEARIMQAGFEIVKERQMEFEIESDPEMMYELFGEDYESFAEGPVWVYVLEKADAVEAFQSLMGHRDPEIAKQESSNSLRALYGISKTQNAIMGSPDVQSAEIQIMSIFASSPPFPTSELPETSDSSLPPSDSSLNFEYQELSPNSKSRHGRATSERSSETRSSTVNGRSGNNGKPAFRARAVPITTLKPDIVPRMSRAAALRIGAPVEATKPKRHPATTESLAKTFAGVPGHKRTETIHVASTDPPAVAPRMTRAMSLRLGLEVPSKPKARASTGGIESRTFDGVPGHKRRESIPVASTKPPVTPPRTNRSATLRIQREAAPPPSSFNIRNPEAFIRSSSRTSQNAQSVRPPSAASPGRPTARPSSALALKPSNGVNVAAETTTESAASKPKPRIVSTPPTIAPRTNKSAQLRAAKMANSAPTASARATGANGATTAKIPVKKIIAPRVAKVSDV